MKQKLVPAPLLEAAEAERDNLKRTLRQRSVNDALAAMEGLEVLLDLAAEGDLAALGAVQRWARIVDRLEKGRVALGGNGR